MVKHFHGKTIGLYGANIKKVEEETMTIIEIPAVTSIVMLLLLLGMKRQSGNKRS